MLRALAKLTLAASVVLAAACSQSDPGITTSVKSRLAADDTVKAYQIDVDTKEGVVTLRGSVNNAAAKEQAVTIARQTQGVRDVVDQITVGAEADTGGPMMEPAEEAERDARGTAGEAVDRAQGATGDAGITAAVKTKFVADPAVSGIKIDVDTDDGVVTLTGTAANKAAANRAVELARETEGVKRVINNIRIGD
jgi:hyperosmotically inducible protein